MKDWADITAESIGATLDRAPHKDNADYVAHFREAVSKALREAYRRGVQDQQNKPQS